ncbi:MAG: trypsin-like peptidase domain-containing protein [Eubacteriales bacterium]|nr:trypsin-like peptidase domain-containing protein [Eubacteriales bacterium]
MENNEYQWYIYAQEEEQRSDDRKTKRRLRIWRTIGIIAIVLALIAGTSAAFGRISEKDEPEHDFDSDFFMTDDGDDSGFTVPWGSGDDPFAYQDEMPDSFKDFFKEYFVEDDSTKLTSDINIPQEAAPGDFEVVLTAPHSDILDLVELYEKCAPSVVAIYGTVDGEVGFYYGTGIVLTEDGLILTNTHVIEGCDAATVKLSDDSEFEATLVGADAISDLAVLKIDADGLTPAEFGISDDLRVGEDVAAIGNPLGEEFRQTLTNGIISAIDRGISYKGRSMTLIQTNTALNNGNSGGALFNMYGQVIGVTNMKMMSSYSSIEGIGFAIPSSTVRTIVASLMKYGKVIGRPSLGLTVGSIPENALEKYDMPEGVYVAGVQENSDAAKVGIREGDVILEVNGTEVTTADEINDLKNEFQVGDSMNFKIWREGETLEFDVMLMDTNDIY